MSHHQYVISTMATDVSIRKMIIHPYELFFFVYNFHSGEREDRFWEKRNLICITREQNVFNH